MSSKVFTTNDDDAGNQADNELYMLSGNDVVSGTNATYVEIYGGAGEDDLSYGSGLAGVCLIYGGTGNDDLDNGTGGGGVVRVLYGGDGNDYLDGDQSVGNNSFYGGAGNDNFDGGSGSEMFDCGTGDDGVFGGNGNDRMYGGDGVDTLWGELGDDIIEGGSGNDYVGGGAGPNGEAGNDRLYGGDGDDVIQAGDGDDRLYGGDGDDILAGGAGTNRYFGGDGADLFVFQDGATNIVLDFSGDGTSNGEPGDTLDLSQIDAKEGKSGDQGFKYIGSKSFHDKAGELRFVNGKLLGDTDGNGKADIKIILHHVDSLSASDLFL